MVHQSIGRGESPAFVLGQPFHPVREDAIFNDEECREFAADLIPRVGMTVSLYRYTGEPVEVANYNRNSLRLFDPADNIVQDVANFTILFGQILFQVWVQKLPPDGIPLPFGDSIISLWPLDMETLYWPPAREIDVHEFELIQFGCDYILDRMIKQRPGQFKRR